jgi:hypothetical protein
MASGFAHRRAKPAIYKLNVYPRSSIWACRWESSREPPRKQHLKAKHARQQNRAKDPGRGRRRHGCRKAHFRQTHHTGLSTMPLEIVHEILLNLDLKSLGNTRQVNSQFQRCVESLPAFTLLRQHAPHTLEVIHRAGLASAVTMQSNLKNFAGHSVVDAVHSAPSSFSQVFCDPVSVVSSISPSSDEAD